MRIFLGLVLALLAALPVFAQTQTLPPAKPEASLGGLPDIIARSWAGQTIDIHNLQGSPVLLIFWEKPPSGC